MLKKAQNTKVDYLNNEKTESLGEAGAQHGGIMRRSARVNRRLVSELNDESWKRSCGGDAGITIQDCSNQATWQSQNVEKTRREL